MKPFRGRFKWKTNKSKWKIDQGLNNLLTLMSSKYDKHVTDSFAVHSELASSKLQIFAQAGTEARAPVQCSVVSLSALSKAKQSRSDCVAFYKIL